MPKFKPGDVIRSYNKELYRTRLIIDLGNFKNAYKSIVIENSTYDYLTYDYVDEEYDLYTEAFSE